MTASADQDPTVIEWVMAHESIRQLVAHYAVALDSRDLDALAMLFVDNVRVSRDAVGRDALRESFRLMLSDIDVSILNVGTHAIDVVDANHATGVVYCHGQLHAGDRWIHQQIVYSDDYERRDGTWLFVRRKHELFYGEVAPSNPLTQAPANWPERHHGRGTVPESWRTWQAFVDATNPNRHEAP